MELGVKRWLKGRSIVADYNPVINRLHSTLLTHQHSQRRFPLPKYLVLPDRSRIATGVMETWLCDTEGGVQQFCLGYGFRKMIDRDYMPTGLSACNTKAVGPCLVARREARMNGMTKRHSVGWCWCTVQETLAKGNLECCRRDLDEDHIRESQYSVRSTPPKSTRPKIERASAMYYCTVPLSTMAPSECRVAFSMSYTGP